MLEASHSAALEPTLEPADEQVEPDIEDDGPGEFSRARGDLGRSRVAPRIDRVGAAPPGRAQIRLVLRALAHQRTVDEHDERLMTLRRLALVEAGGAERVEQVLRQTRT
jgi:hypothetical protein